MQFWKVCCLIREASMQLSNGGHIGMASKSQICEFLHQDLNFGAFFIVLNMYFIFFIKNLYKTMWRSGKHSCLGSRRPGFKSHYCQKSFFSFKSWRRNSKICDQDAISIWLPLNNCVDASLRIQTIRLYKNTTKDISELLVLLVKIFFEIAIVALA